MGPSQEKSPGEQYSLNSVVRQHVGQQKKTKPNAEPKECRIEVKDGLVLGRWSV